MDVLVIFVIFPNKTIQLVKWFETIKQFQALPCLSGVVVDELSIIDWIRSLH